MAYRRYSNAPRVDHATHLAKRKWVVPSAQFDRLLMVLLSSIITFTTLGYGDVHPIGLSRAFTSIESALGIFMTAIFIFVLNRKMLR